MVRRFIRRIFAHLQDAVTARFPDNKQITANYSIVGGFIFLRFFCSAIFSPFGFGVAAEQPKPDAMRAFVLVSKVLQMIANGLSFSDKTSEEYAHTRATRNT
jgi:neurofibromin 1